MTDPAAGMVPFPLLGKDGLAALELLGIPVHIYSFETQRICWSNGPAQAFWSAQSSAELGERDVGPQSASTAIRLTEYREDFERGEQRTDIWTFFPHGRPASALCRCRGVSLEGHAQAMLVEIHVANEGELQSSDMRAIEALRHIPMMLTLFSLEGAVLMRNPAATAAFAAFDRHPAPDADHFAAMFVNRIDGTRLREEARTSGVARSTAPVAIEGWPVHSFQIWVVTDPITGGPSLLVAQQDVSELVEVSRQLAASEEALEAVLMLDVAPALVIAVEDARVVRANHAAEVLFGEGAAKGVDFTSLAVDPAQFDRLRGMLLTQGAGSAVLAFRGARGQAAWCSVSGARIHYANRDALVMLFANVDELYQTAAELEAALNLERSASRLQQRLLSVASHEFRAPLAVIDSTAQQIERKALRMNGEQLIARAGRIRDAVRRLLRLYDETLERGRSGLGTMGYAPQPGQLTDLIHAVVHSFALGDPAPAFRLDLPKLPEIAFDPLMIESAFSNVVGNAIKYSDPPAQVEVSAAVGIDEIVVTIRDHGIGIPIAEREVVFGERVRGSNVGGRPGTGIGLSLVRQIMELHGGGITIVNTPGEAGTTFKLTFPRP